MYQLFPGATVLVFKDGTKAPCDEDGSRLMTFLRAASSGDPTIGIYVKHGRGRLLRAMSEVDIEATFFALRGMVRGSDPPAKPPPPPMEA